MERPVAPRPASSPKESPGTPKSTWIGSRARLEGKITSSDDICVQGSVKGEVRSQGAVTVPEGGTVEATVRGRSVTVHGQVRGNIEAGELTELAATASLVGDVTSPHVVMALGAEFDGTIRRRTPASAGPGAPPKKTPEAPPKG